MAIYWVGAFIKAFIISTTITLHKNFNFVAEWTYNFGREIKKTEYFVSASHHDVKKVNRCRKI